jgi:hypothetical protein
MYGQLQTIAANSGGGFPTGTTQYKKSLWGTTTGSASAQTIQTSAITTALGIQSMDLFAAIGTISIGVTIWEQSTGTAATAGTSYLSTNTFLPPTFAPVGGSPTDSTPLPFTAYDSSNDADNNHAALGYVIYQETLTVSTFTFDVTVQLARGYIGPGNDNQCFGSSNGGFELRFSGSGTGGPGPGTAIFFTIDFVNTIATKQYQIYQILGGKITQSGTSIPTATFCVPYSILSPFNLISRLYASPSLTLNTQATLTWPSLFLPLHVHQGLALLNISNTQSIYPVSLRFALCTSSQAKPITYGEIDIHATDQLVNDLSDLVDYFPQTSTYGWGADSTTIDTQYTNQLGYSGMPSSVNLFFEAELYGLNCMTATPITPPQWWLTDITFTSTYLYIDEINFTIGGRACQCPN